MSKRASRLPAREQADLFGAAGLPAAKPPPRRKATQASPTKPSPAPASARNSDATSSGALLNVRQAATRLGLSKSTLDKMRCAGKGPRFIKSTDRAVRYDPIDLDAWIAERRRRSTSDS